MTSLYQRDWGQGIGQLCGMSKESDSIVVVVSEETGKISIAKDGTLIVDVKEEALKQILIKNIITKRFGNEVITARAKSIKSKSDAKPWIDKIKDKFKK